MRLGDFVEDEPAGPKFCAVAESYPQKTLVERSAASVAREIHRELEALDPAPVVATLRAVASDEVDALFAASQAAVDTSAEAHDVERLRAELDEAQRRLASKRQSEHEAASRQARRVATAFAQRRTALVAHAATRRAAKLRDAAEVFRAHNAGSLCQKCGCLYRTVLQPCEYGCDATCGCDVSPCRRCGVFRCEDHARSHEAVCRKTAARRCGYNAHTDVLGGCCGKRPGSKTCFHCGRACCDDCLVTCDGNLDPMRHMPCTASWCKACRAAGTLVTRHCCGDSSFYVLATNLRVPRGIRF